MSQSERSRGKGIYEPIREIDGEGYICPNQRDRGPICAVQCNVFFYLIRVRSICIG